MRLLVLAVIGCGGPSGSPDASTGDRPGDLDAAPEGVAPTDAPTAPSDAPPVVDDELVVVLWKTQLTAGANCLLPNTNDKFQLAPGDPLVLRAFAPSGTLVAGGYTTYARLFHRENGRWTDAYNTPPVYTILDPDQTGTTIDGAGRIVTGSSPGTVHVIATMGNRQSSPAGGTLSIVSGTLESVTINPADDGDHGSQSYGADPAYVPQGALHPTGVVGTFTSGAFCISDSALWTSNDPSVWIGLGGAYVYGKAPGDAIVTATIAAHADTIDVHVGPPEVQQVYPVPLDSTMPANGSVQLALLAYFTDGTTHDVTGESGVEWSVASGPLAVTTGGLVTAPGAATGDAGTVLGCYRSTFRDPQGITHANQRMCSDATLNDPFAPVYPHPDFPYRWYARVVIE